MTKKFQTLILNKNMGGEVVKLKNVFDIWYYFCNCSYSQKVSYSWWLKTTSKKGLVSDSTGICN